ncbi:mannitol dehydrogenase [Nitzschia inconspicua]|uniref:Mannitol dehydrogenase n=1 Tax=Nitzschia inconspicua TaxID=303405 RepID=A0A9K3L5J2_9STRA|nr:mannitol dehydrogenase [Nitzschia inconspicua]
MTSSLTTITTTHWLAPADDAVFDKSAPLALCLGTGRFLRSVLVPALVGAGMKPILLQTRGRSFLEYMQQRQGQQASGDNNTKPTLSYEVDTVQPDGTVVTDHVPCGGAFSLGNAQDKQAAFDWIASQSQRQCCISILGVGVTEAGLASKDTQVMKDLYELLQLLQKQGQPLSGKLCIVNTDNVPNNASVIQSYMMDIANNHNDTDTTMQTFLSTKVAFLNSMVDRITSQRDGSNGLVPRCEPIPAKALVLLDPQHDMPPTMNGQPGVVIRTTSEQLETDIALKLRIANGTHTAIAHTLALLRHFQTDVLSNNDSNGPLFMKFLDSLVTRQIIPAAVASKSISASQGDADAAWQDWRQRLLHPCFGLSTFFITQNGTAKGGIRWGPTVTDLIASNRPITAATAFAYAVLLRWLTPYFHTDADDTNAIYKGWLDGFNPDDVVVKSGKNNHIDPKDGGEVVEYADGLCYCVKEGWYEYKCPLSVANVRGKNGRSSLPALLGGCVGRRPNKCVVAVRTYLLASTGGDLDPTTIGSKPEFESLVHAIASFYSRMVDTTIPTDKQEGNKLILDLLMELESNSVGGLIGFDTPCTAMMDHFMYLSGI